MALSRWRFRSVLLLTTVLSGAGGLVDFAMLQRWNTTYLGIPDRVFYLGGDAVLHSLVDLLYFIPGSALIGKACPPGLESATYAYLAGISNFARLFASLAGALALQVAGVTTVNNAHTPCNWDALPWLLLGGHIILMLAVSLPAAWLIPNVAQTSELARDLHEAHHRRRPGEDQHEDDDSDTELLDVIELDLGDTEVDEF